MSKNERPFSDGARQMDSGGIFMRRKIVKIDRDKCNGCGACAAACQEGAIQMSGGKAAVVREDYCDGLGNCLPHCPTGAIAIEEREAVPFDEAAVKAAQEELAAKNSAPASGCPGSAARAIFRPLPGGAPRMCPGPMARAVRHDAAEAPETAGAPADLRSRLSQWPVQIKLAPVSAPFFKDASLLVAADCTAYAYGAFHRDFIKNRVVLIGCPKLDEGDYREKLTEIIKNNEIKSETIVRMEVPCCGGLEKAACAALMDSGKFIPWQVVSIGVDGRVVE